MFWLAPCTYTTLIDVDIDYISHTYIIYEKFDSIENNIFPTTQKTPPQSPSIFRKCIYTKQNANIRQGSNSLGYRNVDVMNRLQCGCIYIDCVR